MVIQLNAANKISDHTMLTELGFDYDEEQKAIQKETEDRNRIQSLMMKSQTQAQGEAQIEQAKYQVKAQVAMQQAQQASGLMPQPQPGQEGQQEAPPPGQEQGQEQAQSAVPAQPPAGEDVQMAQQAAMQQAAQMQAPVPGQSEPTGGGQVIEMNASRVAKQWANRLSKMAPQQQQQVLAELRAKMPNMANLVVQILSTMSPGQTASEATEAQRPLPQKLPPNRKLSPV
jgi:hypothetical protein